MHSFLHKIRIVFLLSFLTISVKSFAGTGDTTLVNGFVNLLHQNCNTGRGTFAFPSDSLKYYKILLKYQLTCPSFGCDIYDRIATLKVLHPTGTYDSTLTLAPSFRVNNQVVDSFSYMNDTSYSYSWNSTTNSIDSTALPVQTVLLYNDSANPLVSTDTLLVWPAYYNQYTFVNGIATDSVLVTPDATLLNVYDSIYNVFEVKMPIEIARAITPYGMAVTLWFDVTDYSSILKDSVTLDSRVCGYSNGWLVTTDFYFIEGNPPQHAYKVQNLWNGTWQYGNTANPIETHLQPKTLYRDPQSVKEVVRLITTGHGFGGNPNQLVAEFYDVTHYLRVNNDDLPQHLWRDDCGSNPLYAQGAPGYTSTWFYNRANWCPGSYVNPFDYDVTAYANPTDSFTVDYNMSPYTVTGGPSGFYYPEYYIQSHRISYDTISYQNNAAVITIKKPSNAFEYNRVNPICSGVNPEIVIKNYGAAPLTSLIIHYGVDGVDSVFNWSGSLNFLDTTTVLLPDISFTPGSHVFTVSLEQPNGTTDEFVYDNLLRTNFNTPNTYAASFIRIMVKTDNSPNEISWRVTDNSGNVIASRNSYPAAGVTYIDTVFLATGCYNATALDAGEDGLCCYNGNGFFRVLKGGTGTIIATKGDYGDFYSVNFNIDNSTGVDELENVSEQVHLYPNPSTGRVSINTSFESSRMTAYLSDLAGRPVTDVLNVTVNAHQAELDFQQLPNGIYFLILSDANRKIVRKITIAN